MTIVYYYYVGTPPDIVAKVALLDSRLSIDLEILVANYVSTVYNSGTKYVEVTYSAPLDYLPINTLNNIITLILFNGTLGDTVYYDDFNTGTRRSFRVSSTPTTDHDASSGYSVGSMVITTSNDIYICTDNTVAAAIWIHI